MPYIDLIGYTRLADLGLSLDKGTNLNYRYSLPNKLFDYIHAGIPILCSDIVEVANIVNSYKLGFIVKSLEPQEIANNINIMFDNEDQTKQWKKNLRIAASELCWENEEIELLKLYNKIRVTNK